MSQPLTPGSHALAVPRFYVTPRQRFSPGAVLLAILIAFACLLITIYALAHSRHRHVDGSNFLQFGSSDADNDDDDDPSRMDTIYLGDPGTAPSATRPRGRPSTVHPFRVVQLPRSGDQTGQIPDTPTGRLLYAWLAAFNGSDPAALPKALPTIDPASTQAAQLELRQQTGGFTLVSAKEIQPGLLVFRLHDQTTAETEVLGTLEANVDAFPARITSLSLRAVPPTPAKAR